MKCPALKAGKEDTLSKCEYTYPQFCFQYKKEINESKQLRWRGVFPKTSALIFQVDRFSLKAMS